MKYLYLLLLIFTTNSYAQVNNWIDIKDTVKYNLNEVSVKDSAIIIEMINLADKNGCSIIKKKNREFSFMVNENNDCIYIELIQAKPSPFSKYNGYFYFQNNLFFVSGSAVNRLFQIKKNMRLFEYKNLTIINKNNTIKYALFDVDEPTTWVFKYQNKKLYFIELYDCY